MLVHLHFDGHVAAVRTELPDNSVQTTKQFSTNFQTIQHKLQHTVFQYVTTTTKITGHKSLTTLLLTKNTFCIVYRQNGLNFLWNYRFFTVTLQQTIRQNENKHE